MNLKILNEVNNPLFLRTEVKAEVEKEIVPSREEVLDLFATKYKADKEAIKIMTIKGKFGSKTFEANAHIYSSIDEKNRIEVKTKQEKEAEKKAKEDAEKAEAEERKAKEESEKVSETSKQEEINSEEELTETTPSKETKEEAKE